MKSIKFLALLLVFSCNKEEPFLPLTPELVTEIHAYDLDNNGNSSDIRLEFEVRNNLNVLEYRVMFVPAGLINSFDQIAAAGVPSSNYLEVEPESFRVLYSFNRLPAELNDVNGSPIRNNVEYILVVYSLGATDQQLSSPSKPIKLKDIGIYSGQYYFGWELECIKNRETAPVATKVPTDGTWILELTGSEDNYTATQSCPECSPLDISILLSIEGQNITSWTREWANQPCWDLSYCLGETCYFIENGTGAIIDELTIEISITSDDCIANCNGKSILRRI